MLTSIRIQNFRSIRDAQVKLGKVNLFIGPNNSGKSNFLKGIELFTHGLSVYPKEYLVSIDKFNQFLTKRKYTNFQSEEILFSIKFTTESLHLHVPKSDVVGLVFPINIGKRFSLQFDPGTDSFIPEDYKESSSIAGIVRGIREQLGGVKVYKIEPSLFQFSIELSEEFSLDEKGGNIAAFLNTISQNHEKNFLSLKKDFSECVDNFISVSTPPDPHKRGNLKLKFFDSEGHHYWAEEVSEGVLYFLALLCIIHQPNPPKLLLLEEPEKGIHPRRIREVMDFIFELARLRDIQIILTSHSPYVVDHFADIPECISVFDRENGETVVRNAADIIAENNATLENPIRYSDALGEHWVSGFLGGVPL